MLSYYQILQVEENSTQDEIKRSYRKLCKILHPDMHGNTPEATIIFRLLHEAYETISNPAKRINYKSKDHSATFGGISHNEYDEIIAGYKKIVSDYEGIIRTKNRREKDLLNQVNQLKKIAKDLKISSKEHSKSTSVDIKIESKKKDSNVIWIILIVLGIITFILFVIYPFLMTSILVLTLFVSWIYKTFY